MEKKNLSRIWLQQYFNDVLLNWKEIMIAFRNNFILIPSTMLICAFLLGYINELNSETIKHYFIPIGIFSFLINTAINAAVQLSFPNRFSCPYISKGIEDIREEKDSEKTYIYFLKLKFGNYIIKEKDNNIDIIKVDGTYSVNKKKD